MQPTVSYPGNALLTNDNELKSISAVDPLGIAYDQPNRKLVISLDKTKFDDRFVTQTSLETQLLDKQNKLNVLPATGAVSLLNSDTLRCINATSPLTLTSDAFTVTLNLNETTLANNFYNKTTADNTFNPKLTTPRTLHH